MYTKEKGKIHKGRRETCFYNTTLLCHWKMEERTEAILLLW